LAQASCRFSTPSPSFIDEDPEEFDGLYQSNGPFSPIYAVPYAVKAVDQRQYGEMNGGYRSVNPISHHNPQYNVRHSKNFFEFHSSSSDSEEVEDEDTTSCSSWTAIAPRQSINLQNKKRIVPVFHPPPPPPAPTQLSRAEEFDFLAELDQQIAELQVRIFNKFSYNFHINFQ
jgi:hypothetical protein